MNGNLADAIRQTDAELCVSQFPSSCPDILAKRSSDRQLAIEAKHVYDMTLAKYFAQVTADRSKLLKYKAVNGSADVWQVVFFVQLPEADYPTGRWYGNKQGKRRCDYIKHRNILSQYKKVEGALGAATWPAGSPYIQPLRWPPVSFDPVLLSRWFDDIFKPDQSWNFDPRTYLHNAAVGVATWRH